MTLFEKNIKTLSKIDAQLADRIKNTSKNDEFKAFPAKNGEITLSINENQVYSKYNPSQEILRFTDANKVEKETTLFFFGFGLGYHLKQYIKLLEIKSKKNIQIIIVEPEITLFRSAFEIIDIQSIIYKNYPITFLVGYTTESVLNIATKIGYPNYKIITTKGLQINRENWFNDAENLLTRYEESWQVNISTGKKFSKLWLRHIFGSIQRIKNNNKKIFPVSELIKKFKNIDALIVAAGPSLTQSIELLKLYEEKGLLIAVDTAMNFLVKKNITPHFVVVSDCQYWNSRHLDRIDLKNIRILTELSVHPSLFSKQTGPVYLYSSRIPTQRAIENLTQEFGALGTGGSVATTAWDFARSAGCSSITCCGLDLSFPKGQTHIKEGRFEQLIFSKCTRKESFENSNMNYLYNEFSYKIIDPTGKKLWTDEKMILFKNWFEQQIKRYPGTYYRINKNGIKLKGMNPFDKKILEKLKNKKNNNTLELFQKIEKNIKIIDFRDNLKEIFIKKLNDTSNRLKTNPSGIELLRNPFLAILYYELLQEKEIINLDEIDFIKKSKQKSSELKNMINTLKL